MGISVNKTAGLTLVEALVSAAIAAVIGTVMITVLSMNSRQVEASSCAMKMSMGYDIAVSDIGQSVRSASFALSTIDTFPPSASRPCSVKVITLRSPTGQTVGGYTITTAGVLQEFDTSSNSWKDFRITPSSTPVMVTSLPASRFILSPSRKQVTLELNVYATFGKVSDTFRSGRESFLCRNQ